jgi:hypothetical protein
VRERARTRVLERLRPAKDRIDAAEAAMDVILGVEEPVPFRPLRHLPPSAGYRRGDVLVLFGELFGRGYANGIVDAARKAGMTIVGATVGRRDPDGTLRPLDATELAEAERNLGGAIVNVPLEAGFDLEPGGDGPSPVEQVKGANLDEWQTFSLDWELIARSRAAGARRFEENVKVFVAELSSLLPPEASVLFVHTMAGGFPRTRAYMPLTSRLFRGMGDRFLPSAAFWASDLGKLWAACFDEVTARTFQRLVAATAPIRAGKRRVRYVAFGYHGCEVLVGGEPIWQTYVPYLQGWAKLLLERSAEEASAAGVACTVFNCPEIWTNSSAIFRGVEISLYPLLAALEREGTQSAAAEAIRERCRALLKKGATLDDLLARADAFLASPVMSAFRKLEDWPQHSTREQTEAMLHASADLMAMNADPKTPVVEELSRAVVKAVGPIMFDASWEPAAPVVWLNHDVIAQRLAAG